MSETQAEYGTDAEPTLGPWEDDMAPMDGVDGISIFATDEDDNLFVVASVNTPNTGLLEGDWRSNACLIAAAGTAAQEAKEMGYDPQEALEMLPKWLSLLESCSKALTEDTYGWVALEHEVKDALDSAEGRGDE